MDMQKAKYEFEAMIHRGGPWALWATITFRLPKGLAEARNAFRHFLRRLNTGKEILVNDFTFSFVCFEATERKGVHIHALIRGIHPLHAEKIQKKCEDAFGISKVRPYSPAIQPNATLYLASKYGQSNLLDYGFMKVDPRILKKSMTNRSMIQI